MTENTSKMQSLRIISMLGGKSCKQILKLTYCQQKYFSYLQRRFYTRDDAKKIRKSALFATSEANEKNIPVELDLDICKRLKAKDQLKSELLLRNVDGIDIDQMERDYIRVTEIKQTMTKLEGEKQKIAQTVSKLLQRKTEDSTEMKHIEEIVAHLKKKGIVVKKQMKDLLPEERETDYRMMMAALRLPNRLHRNTPLYEDKIEEIYGAETSGTLSHIDIGEQYGLIDLSNVGIKAYYLNDTLALLEQALISYFSDRLRQDDFIQLACPEFFRRLIVEGCGINPENPNKILKLKPKPDDPVEYFLSGVSIMSFIAYLAKHRIKNDCLPLKYFACGRSYKPEKKYLSGLFGATQTVKTNMLAVVTDLLESDMMYKSLRDSLWNTYKQFGIPCRLITRPSIALHKSEELRTEIQIWAKSLQKYIEVASVSIVSDYISRRLMIRKGKESIPVHMVHSEVMDVTRLIAILLEYGSVKEDTYTLPDLEFLSSHWIQQTNTSIK